MSKTKNFILILENPPNLFFIFIQITMMLLMNN